MAIKEREDDETPLYTQKQDLPSQINICDNLGDIMPPPGLARRLHSSSSPVHSDSNRCHKIAWSTSQGSMGSPSHNGRK